MADDYTLTTDDLPEDDPHTKDAAEWLCNALADSRMPNIAAIWDDLSEDQRARMLGAVAPGNRWRSSSMLAHMQGALRKLDGLLFGGETDSTNDPDVRYVTVYDAEGDESQMGMARIRDADLVVTVLRCADGQWRVAGFGGPARPEDIPRQ